MGVVLDHGSTTSGAYSVPIAATDTVGSSLLATGLQFENGEGKSGSSHRSCHSTVVSNGAGPKVTLASSGGTSCAMSRGLDGSVTAASTAHIRVVLHATAVANRLEAGVLEAGSDRRGMSRAGTTPAAAAGMTAAGTTTGSYS